MKRKDEQKIKQLKKALEVRENAEKLMAVSRVILAEVVNDELFDTLNPAVQAVMLSTALLDYMTGLDAQPFTKGYLDHVLEDKEPAYATAVYIYCNWRVWAVHNMDEKLAHKYQAVCDKIDDYVFEHWSKDSIGFFVEQTD